MDEFKEPSEKRVSPENILNILLCHFSVILSEGPGPPVKKTSLKFEQHDTSKSLPLLQILVLCLPLAQGSLD